MENDNDNELQDYNSENEEHGYNNGKEFKGNEIKQ